MDQFSREEAWGNIWETGCLSSLRKEDETGTNPQAKDEWEAFFSRLPGKASILDICTGNGAVPLLANQYAAKHNKTFEITGIDLASIKPIETVKGHIGGLTGINFIGGVNAEDLYFSDASFDAVTGQYALEYTGITKSGRELARVLKPGGRARFVIHAKQSAIVLTNTPKAKQYDLILKSGVLDALEYATKLAMEFENRNNCITKDQVLDARENLKNQLILVKRNVLSIAHSEDILNLLDDLVKSYVMRRNFKTWSNFHAWVVFTREQIMVLRVILGAMAEAAKSEEDLKTIQSILTENGLCDFACGKLYFEYRDLHGWTLECRKP